MPIGSTISWGSAAAYAGILFLAVATPGPAMFTVIGTGLSQGRAPAMAIGIGIAVGDAFLVAAALLGLATLVQTAPWFLGLVKYGGGSYLLYLAVLLLRADPGQNSNTAIHKRGLIQSGASGLAVALSNPKAILFHASLLPLFVVFNRVSWIDAGMLLLIVVAVNIATMGGYAALSVRMSHWFRSPARMMALNRICGGVLATAAILIVWR